MLVKNKNSLLSVIFIALAILACNLPGGTPPTAEPTTDIDTPTPTFTPIVIASETPVPTATTCVPTLTTNVEANVRSGPGQVYGIIGAIPQGGIANVAGKNFDGTWWYIEFAGGNGGFAWIAGSITTATCIPSTLASIAAPPTPVLPTATPTLVPSATSTLQILIIPPFFFYTPTPTLIKIIIPPFIINP